MNWLLAACYVLWMFTLLPCPFVSLWYILGGRHYHQPLAVPYVFGTMEYNTFNQSFIETPLLMSPAEGEDDQNEQEKLPLLHIRLTETIALVGYDNPKISIYLQIKKTTNGLSRVTWINITLIVQLLHFVLLALGAFGVLCYKLCLLVFRAIKGLLAFGWMSGSHQYEQQMLMAALEQGLFAERVSDSGQLVEETEQDKYVLAGRQTIPERAANLGSMEAVRPKRQKVISEAFRPGSNNSVSLFELMTSEKEERAAPLHEPSGQTSNMNFTNFATPTEKVRIMGTAATGQGVNSWGEPMNYTLFSENLRNSSSWCSMEVDKLSNDASSNNISMKTERSLMNNQGSGGGIEYMDCSEDSPKLSASVDTLHLEFAALLKISSDVDIQGQNPPKSTMLNGSWVSAITGCQEKYQQLLMEQEIRGARGNTGRFIMTPGRLQWRRQSPARTEGIQGIPLKASHSVRFVLNAERPEKSGSDVAATEDMGPTPKTAKRIAKEFPIYLKKKWLESTDIDDNVSCDNGHDNDVDTHVSNEANNKDGKEEYSVNSYYNSNLSTNTSTDYLLSTRSSDMYRSSSVKVRSETIARSEFTSTLYPGRSLYYRISHTDLSIGLRRSIDRRSDSKKKANERDLIGAGNVIPGASNANYQPSERTGLVESTAMPIGLGQGLMTNNDQENTDGTVEVTSSLPDGQPFTLNSNRLD